MSSARLLSSMIALLVVASACGAEPDTASEGAAFVEETTTSLIEVESTTPPNLFLPTVADMPDHLQLITAGDLSGQTVHPAGNLVDGASWDGNLAMELSLDNGMGWTQPLVDVGFAVVVDQVDADEWRYLVSYSEASLTELVDNSEAVNAELAEELMASYSALSIVSTVDAFGVVSDTQVLGVERVPVAYQFEITDFAAQMSDLTTPVAAGPLGVGARWTDRSTSRLFGASVEATYTYEIVAIDGPVYTLDFSFSALSSDEEGSVETASASGTIVAEVGKPIPLRSSFSVTSLLPVGYDDATDPVATIDVVLEGS